MDMYTVPIYATINAAKRRITKSRPETEIFFWKYAWQRWLLVHSGEIYKSFFIWFRSPSLWANIKKHSLEKIRGGGRRVRPPP